MLLISFVTIFDYLCLWFQLNALNNGLFIKVQFHTTAMELPSAMTLDQITIFSKPEKKLWTMSVLRELDFNLSKQRTVSGHIYIRSCMSIKLHSLLHDGKKSQFSGLTNNWGGRRRELTVTKIKENLYFVVDSILSNTLSILSNVFTLQAPEHT